jgi:hypothetical protein
MLSRIAVPFLCVAAIVFACAPRPHAAETAAHASTSSTFSPKTPSLATRGSLSTTTTPAPRLTKAMRAEIARQPLAATVDVAVRRGEVKGTRDVKFTLHVANRAEKNVELMFPSGQTHDFVVRDSAGREVWRWSEGRMFTQALQSKAISGGDEATYEEAWSAGTRAGRFTVEATLRSTNHVVAHTQAFVLP